MTQLIIPCDVCREVATEIELTGQTLRVNSVIARASYNLAPLLPQQQQEELASAIEAKDVRAVYRIDAEFIPSFCPQCQLNYCRAHWAIWQVFDPDWDSWYEESRGWCPQGHERQFDD